MTEHLMNTYGRQPVTFAKGEGALLWDTNGKQYLDALSGIAVCGLGHAHPDVTRTICEQASTLVHTSNLYHIEKQNELADKLCQLTEMDKVFFCNSGAEANEAAIKLARLHGSRKGIADPKIIVAENSFHGRTLATLSATGNRKIQAGFEPLVRGFLRVPFNDLESPRSIASNQSDVVAIMVEPVQGEGGIRVPASDYVRELRTLCDQTGWLLMLDEVQSGVCRTGRWLASQHSGVKADVVTLAKGLGNGMPIGACLALGEAANVFQPGNHGSTFGGGALACATALAVLNVYERDNLCARATELGERMLAGFKTRLEGHANITNIRGHGLMLGIELNEPCADIVSTALEQGLLINVTAGNTIRLLPPLVISDAQADEIVDRVCALVENRYASVEAA